MKREKIAVIGGGAAGLTSAYLLREKYDVTLYEKTDRVGGNAYTHQLKNGQHVDIAACVFGSHCKGLMKLFSELGVELVTPEQTFVSLHNLDTKEGLYIDFSPKALFAQKFQLLKPSKLKAVLNLILGVQKALEYKHQNNFKGCTIRELCSCVPQLSGETLYIAIFSMCLITSMCYDDVMNAPAALFFDKLSVWKDALSFKKLFSKNQLVCIKGFTKAYVDKISSHLDKKIVLNSNIKSVSRNTTHVVVSFDDGQEKLFDHVIFSCPPDSALSILVDPTSEEKRLLGVWRYQEGPVVVHNDFSSFPNPKLCQGFTFLYTDRNGKVETSVNGRCWSQPGVPNDIKYFGSQHPNFPIRKERTDFKIIFRTPIFDLNSYEIIPELPLLNGHQNTYFCGSYFGTGQHEDAVDSAIEVARLLGVEWR
ncbi:MAG: FAD-dependent oxidoreductase [Proteobacteria bacterium]|nr:FAD-dependent oxidoreductase [Pseudomonadota bacterium]